MPKEREVREVIRRLESEGWSSRHGKGSHLVFRKGSRTLTVPTSQRELPQGTYRAIVKQAGWL